MSGSTVALGGGDDVGLGVASAARQLRRSSEAALSDRRRSVRLVAIRRRGIASARPVSPRRPVLGRLRARPASAASPCDSRASAGSRRNPRPTQPVSDVIADGDGEAAAVDRAGRLRAGARRRARRAPDGSGRRAAPECRRAPRARRTPDSRRCDRAPSAISLSAGIEVRPLDGEPLRPSSSPLVSGPPCLSAQSCAASARGAGLSSAGR